MQKFRQSWASAEERPTNFAIPGIKIIRIGRALRVSKYSFDYWLDHFEDNGDNGVLKMASIVKRGKTYSIVYYEGEGKDRHQVWESGLSYNAAKARKAQLEYEVAQNIHIDRNDLTVSEFL